MKTSLLFKTHSGFVTLEVLLKEFMKFASNNEEEEEDEEEMISEEESEDEEEAYNQDDPVTGILALLPASKLAKLSLPLLQKALEEYIQRRLLPNERKALSKAFEAQLKQGLSFDAAAIGTVLSTWQRHLQDGDEEAQEETMKITTLPATEATTYESPAKPKSPRNSLSSENFTEALNRSGHQLRKLREHVQRQRKFIEEQTAAHEAVTLKNKLDFEKRLDEETQKLRRQLNKVQENLRESEQKSERLQHEKHELLLKVRDLEQERSSRTRNQETDKIAVERARDEARATMERLEREYEATVRSFTDSKSKSHRRVEELESKLKNRDVELRETRSELEELKRRHTAQNVIHESLKQSIRDLEDVVMTLRGQSPRKTSRSPSPTNRRKGRSPSAFARFPKRKSWDTSKSKLPLKLKRSRSVSSKDDHLTKMTRDRVISNVEENENEEDLNESLADELAALDVVSTPTIKNNDDLDIPSTPTPRTKKMIEEETTKKEDEEDKSSLSLVSFLNKQCDEAASLVKADDDGIKSAVLLTSKMDRGTSSPPASQKKIENRRKSKTSASLVHQMLQEATSLAHTFKGDYLEIVTHRHALFKHRIHSAGGSVEERLLFSSVVVRLIQPSKLVGFFSSEARQWRRVLILTNLALYEMADVLSLQVRRRVPLDSICTVAMMTDSHDVLALLRRTSYDRVYQTMRRTELVVRLMQACQHLRRGALLSEDKDGRRKNSVRLTVAKAQQMVDANEMSRGEFDAVVRSCARRNAMQYTTPPLRVRFLSKMLLSFSGGQIMQMYFNESSGQIHIIPQDARESAPSAEMAGFVCPMCKMKFPTAAKLLEHYESVHPS